MSIGTICFSIFHFNASKCRKPKTRAPSKELQGGNKFLTCGEIGSSGKEEKQWLGVDNGLCNYNNLKKPKNMYKHVLLRFWFKLYIQ